MPFDFGNIYAMTKDDFQKAIEYYRSRIELIVNDDSISVAVKRWFVKEYNKKIKKLETSHTKLQQKINQIEASGVYVNEDSATLNSLSGTTSLSRKPFKNLGVGKTRHNLAQVLRIVGAVCLPLIGSIPFGIAFHRSKKRYKIRQQENIELGRFMNDSNRTFDATLATNTPFTEKEMRDLLNNPSELARLTNLTNPTNTSLNPDQKKILTKKLATLKTFAQKHGYSVAGLTDPKFNTSADTVNADYTSATATAPANLKQASDKIKELTEIRKSANDLLEADKDNDHLKALVSRIDSTIASYKTMAAGFVSTALSEIDAGLVAPTATDKAGLTASNASLDSTYNTPHAKLGVDLATAKTLADKLEINISEFTAVSNKYSGLKSDINTKLTTIQKRENYETDLATIDSILRIVDVTTVTDHVTATSALANLEQVETLLNRNKSYFESLPVSDPKRTEYQTLFEKHKSSHSEIKKKQNEFEIDASAFSSYQSIITSNAFVGTETKDELIAKKSAVQAALDALKDPRFNDLFDSSPRKADLVNAKNQATSTLSQIDAKLAEIEKDELNASKNITYYQSEVEKNKPETPDTITDLQQKRENLKNILDYIDTDDYKNGIEAEANALIIKAKEHLSAINLALKEYDSFVTNLSGAYNDIMTTLSKGKFTDAKLNTAQKWYKIIKDHDAEAASFGLTSEYKSILNALKGYLETHSFDSKLEVHLPSIT